jgi:hypothetical protein
MMIGGMLRLEMRKEKGVASGFPGDVLCADGGGAGHRRGRGRVKASKATHQGVRFNRGVQVR